MSLQQPLLVLEEELRDFGDSLRGFLEHHATEQDVRSAIETELGYDPALWRRMNSELGLAGLTVPEEFGGAGFGPREAVPANEELGRALVPSPYFGTCVLACNALIAAGDDPVAHELLTRIAAAEITATVAWQEDAAAGIGLGPVTTVATADGICGEKLFVIDGSTADVLIVVANDTDGLSIFAVEATASGVRRANQTVLDLTRRQARVSFDRTQGRRIGPPGSGHRIIDQMLDLAATALVVEQVGAGQKIFDVAVAYVLDRQQFGRPIGSFQAIKFKLADQYGNLEKARALAYNAAWVATHDPANLPSAVSAAKSLCSEATARVAAESLHVHGGIGFTWEHAAHLYFKRLRSSELMLGTPLEHRRRLRAVSLR